MPRKDDLKSMLKNIIQDNDDGAKSDFHRYLKGKMSEIYNGAEAPSEPAPKAEPSEPAPSDSE